MRVAIVVGSNYRDLKSVSRYVARLKNDDVLVIVRPYTTRGEHLASLTAEREGKLVEWMTDGNTALEKLQVRVLLVKNVDTVVLFDDGGIRMEHFYNLAEVNKKKVVQFKEV